MQGTQDCIQGQTSSQISYHLRDHHHPSDQHATCLASTPIIHKLYLPHPMCTHRPRTFTRIHLWLGEPVLTATLDKDSIFTAVRIDELRHCTASWHCIVPGYCGTCAGHWQNLRSKRYSTAEMSSANWQIFEDGLSSSDSGFCSTVWFVKLKFQFLTPIYDEVFTGLYQLGFESLIPLLRLNSNISYYAKILTGGMLSLAVTLALDGNRFSSAMCGSHTGSAPIQT